MSLTNYLQHFKKYPLLTAEEERTATPEKLVLHNLRLAFKAAQCYSGNNNEVLQDLIQEANFGLVRASQRFSAISKNADTGEESLRNNRFSTYAMYYIKLYILKWFYNKSRIVRVPAHLAQLKRKYDIARENLEVQLGYEPSEQDVIDYMGIGERQLESIKKAKYDIRGLNTTQPDGKHDELDIVDINNQTDKIVEKEETARNIRVQISKLDKKTQYVINARFYEGKTLDVVGAELGVTRERVRQIQEKGLARLKETIR